MNQFLHIRLLMLILLISGSLLANPKKPTLLVDDVEICARIDAGLVLDRMINNNNEVYNQGVILKHTYSLKPCSNIGFGVGVGLISLEYENFVPLYFDFIGFFKENSKVYVNLQAGYSPGWKKESTAYNGHDFNGGMHLGAAIGYKFNIGDNLNAYIQTSYQHQNANLTYKIGEHGYTNNLHYDMIAISIGFMRTQK